MPDSDRSKPLRHRFLHAAGILALLVLAGCSQAPDPGQDAEYGQCNVHAEACASVLSPGLALSMEAPEPDVLEEDSSLEVEVDRSFQ